MEGHQALKMLVLMFTIDRAINFAVHPSETNELSVKVNENTIIPEIPEIRRAGYGHQSALLWRIEWPQALERLVIM